MSTVDGFFQKIGGGFNPLRIAVHEFVDIARDVRRAPSLGAALGYIFAPPGWSHDGSSLTADQLRRRQAAAGI